MPLATASRRQFLVGLGLTGAALTLPFSADAGPAGPATVNAWLRIGADDSVTILSNCTEIGQGTGTGIAQIIGEELGLDWSRIRIEMAPIEAVYFNEEEEEYAVWGSIGITTQYARFRKIGAAARVMLCQAAARRWRVAESEVEAGNGLVRHPGTGRTLSYGALAAAASRLPVPADPPLKPRVEWQLVGTAAPRLDLADKVSGRTRYGIDMQHPGMLIATVAQCPVFGGTLKHVDPAPALKIRGVVQVLEFPDMVAVLATGTWSAFKGLEALAPEWHVGPGSDRQTLGMRQQLEAAARAGTGMIYPGQEQLHLLLDPDKKLADHQAALAAAAGKREALYEIPFAAHATLEPMSGLAVVTASSAELWIGTQSQSEAQKFVAMRLGLAPAQVTIHGLPAGGGYGRRIEVDSVDQLARIAQRAKRPVKLIWRRSEDLQHDFYRPGAAIRLQAALGPDRRILSVSFDSATGDISASSLGGAKKDPPGAFNGGAIMGTVRPGYRFANLLHRWAKVDFGVPLGYWRSVGAFANDFALESFINELAEAAEADPVAYRLDLLGDAPRVRAVVAAAADKSGWHDPAPAGRHRGIAVASGNGSVVAHVVELSVTGAKLVKLHRITCVVDCELAVNPDAVRAQMEGGIVWGLTAACFSEITFAEGRVENQNFDSYPLLQLAQTPVIDVIILESGDKPAGVGEEAVAPVAPALAEALFRATGQRIRTIPFANSGFEFV